MRLAWFSPMPPSTSGIAAYSADILPLLASRGCEIDTYTNATAHDFVWRHRRAAYDLTIYQLGNSSLHDYMWGYLFRYPGLVVLHDVQLHQARALYLTKRWLPRLDDYMAEVRANHPNAPADLPYLVLARMGDRMYQHWPMVRLVLERARLVVVHSQWVADDVRAKHATVPVRAIAMGIPDPGVADPQAVQRIRRDLPPSAVLLAAYGGITPEKRIPQLLRALGAIAERHPHVHLMLVGARADHYDVTADAAMHGVSDRVHITGFVADDELPAYLHAADIAVCLRWPTNRETSASWLRCLAAGRPTIISDLAHLGEVPSLDPRGWRMLDTARERREPIAVSVDPLDEDHSLQLALERLVDDRALRDRLGRAARAWWHAHHQLETMADAYLDAMRAASRAPVPNPPLPAHLLADGTTTMREIGEAFGVSDRLLT